MMKNKGNESIIYIIKYLYINITCYKDRKANLPTEDEGFSGFLFAVTIKIPTFGAENRKTNKKIVIVT